MDIDERARSVIPAELKRPELLDDVVQRLAKLPPVESDRIRVAEAKKLGCRVGTLDKEIQRVRSEINDQGGSGNNTPLFESL